MQLSIIVPIYNVEKYLERCAESLVDQKLDNYEILLVDDGSSDESGKLADSFAEKYPEKIKVIHKENGGLSDARNCGIKEACGEYVVFIDGDDYVKKDCFVELMKVIHEGNYDICQFDMCRDYGDKKALHPATSFVNESREITKEEFIISSSSACNKIIRRELLQNMKFEFPYGMWYEDTASIPTLVLYADKIYYAKECCYYYVQREGSITKQELNPKSWDIYTAIMIIKDKIGREFPMETEFFFWEHFMKEAALIYYQAGRFEKLREIAGIMKKEYPHWIRNKYVKKYASFKSKVITWFFYNNLYCVIRLGQTFKKG